MKWREIAMTTSVIDVPSKAGLYAIGHVTTIHGLETEREYVYIGMTKNLNRRLADHNLENQNKAEFKRYLIQNSKGIKCWFTTCVDEAELRSLETKLIRIFKPRFNDTI